MRESVVTVHLVGDISDGRLEIALVDAQILQLVIKLHGHTVLSEANVIRFLGQHDVRSGTANNHLIEFGVVVVSRNANLLDFDIRISLDEILDGLHLVVPVGNS